MGADTEGRTGQGRGQPLQLGEPRPGVPGSAGSVCPRARVHRRVFCQVTFWLLKQKYET